MPDNHAVTSPAPPATFAHSPGRQALADRLHAALPQTQCTRCGYPDCAAYAQAMASGTAAINQCPPGGDEGIRRLASLTGQPVVALNPEHGTEGPRSLAVIDEAWCIGCTLCLDACPTDAILGSNKMMHTVIEAYCTGCELCVPVCPVDCISLDNATGERAGWNAWSAAQAEEALQRYQEHRRRAATAGTDAAATEPDGPAPVVAAVPPDRKQATIAAALARARAKAQQ
ncbi:MAG: electron transport complex subunit RsxB [Polaromonas sp.]|nr:electron transport complex subunit RsxB [Polaromonas sp.]